MRVPYRVRRRWRRVVVLAASLALLPGLVSFVGMFAQPSNSSFFVRAVEWLRSDGARGVVNRVEDIYYSLTAPPTGGPALKALPKQAGAAAAAGQAALSKKKVRIRPYVASRITPVIHPALAGEGMWHPTFSAGGSFDPPVMITSYRPEPQYPQLVAGLAWINQTRTNIMLYPGVQEPAVTMPARGPEEVPATTRHVLVATFNSAFKLLDSGGGFAYNGHTYAPLKSGLATILKYRGGKVNIVDWTGGPNAPSNIVFARQNLPLIINNSKINPNLADGPQWGATVGNAIQVWRSGIGIDRHGNLIYAAANYQTVGSLAAILRHAGAVRAMELDINAYWPSFITYKHPGALNPSNLLAGMQRSPLRYLTPDDRDFFAVYMK